MKRIMLSVFAAAVTAAWVVPASATDVTFSGQYRVRGEYRENAVDFNDDAADTAASMTQRVRLTANAEAAEDTTVKITLQDTRTFGQNGPGSLLTDTTGTAGPDTFPNNTLDLHEAYLNVEKIFGSPIDFRIGRQELAYGDERLIGAFNWNNNGRAFDGTKFSYKQDGINVDLFHMTIANDASAATNDDTRLTGVYATLGQLIPNNTLDLYAINQNGNNSTSLNFYTVGVRVKGAAAGLDYTLEVPYQFGEVTTTGSTTFGANAGDYDLSAWALAAKVGYTIPGAPMNIRIGAEYNYATGDDNANDGDIDTFQVLYPTNHAHFGIGDFTPATNQWSNIQAWSVNASADITEKIRLYVAYWSYSLAEENAAGDDDLGSEIDLIASYKYSNNVSLEAGVSRFMPDDATVGSGNPDDAADWAYLQITANF